MTKPRGRARAASIASEAWKTFDQTPNGRVALAEYFIWCNIYSPIESNDPVEMARLVGERNAALRIVQLIGLKPEDFVQRATDDTDLLTRITEGYS